MVRLAATAALWLTVVGCSAVDGSSGWQKANGESHDIERASVPDSRPNITGIVTEVGHKPGHKPGKEPTSKRILVEESSDGCFESKFSKACNKLYLDTTEKTRVFRKVQGEKEGFDQARLADLQRGQRVLAWHTGVLTKSYPGQGYARVIVIEAT